jgi:hypothetical protein
MEDRPVPYQTFEGCFSGASRRGRPASPLVLAQANRYTAGSPWDAGSVEIRACRKYLNLELQIVGPQFILLLEGPPSASSRRTA